MIPSEPYAFIKQGFHWQLRESGFIQVHPFQYSRIQRGFCYGGICRSGLVSFTSKPGRLQQFIRKDPQDCIVLGVQQRLGVGNDFSWLGLSHAFRAG